MGKDRIWFVGKIEDNRVYYLGDLGTWIKNIEFARPFSRNDAVVISEILCNENEDGDFRPIGVKESEGDSFRCQQI